MLCAARAVVADHETAVRIRVDRGIAVIGLLRGIADRAFGCDLARGAIDDAPVNVVARFGRAGRIGGGVGEIDVVADLFDLGLNPVVAIIIALAARLTTELRNPSYW